MTKFFSLCQKYQYHCLIAVIFLATGFALAFGYFNIRVAPRLVAAVYDDVALHKIHPQENPYPYINPLLAFDIGGRQPSPQFQGLQNHINQTIAVAKQGGQITDVAVYFRDLETGRWTGINETEKFAPGSVMKVALMIAYYKASEDDPGILAKQLTWDGKFDANLSENIPPAQSIKPNQPYSAADLIYYMITYSDNNAMALLLDNFDPAALTRIFSDLMVNLPIHDSTDDLTSPKQLSLMFRVLYNATYLNNALSDKALGLLANTAYRDGIAKGLPAEVAVADKFGERKILSPLANNDVVEFHDCGIVYFPGHPYFLCVMTKGTEGSLDELQHTAANISAAVYGQIKQSYP